MGTIRQLLITALVVEAVAEWPILVRANATYSAHAVLAVTLFLSSYFPRFIMFLIGLFIWKPVKFVLGGLLWSWRRLDGGGRGVTSGNGNSNGNGNENENENTNGKGKGNERDGAGSSKTNAKPKTPPCESDSDGYGFWSGVLWGMVGWSLFVRGVNHLAAAVVLSSD